MKFTITGMSCAACSAKIEKTVSSLSSVRKCEVNLLTATMNVEFIDNFSPSPEEIIKEVEKIGYGAKLSISQKVNLNSSELKKLIFRLIFSVILLFLLFLVKKVDFYSSYLQAFLTVIIMIINFNFFKSGFTSLFHGSPNMDTLVALGSLSSFIYKSFDGAAMILTLITIGKTLESYAKGKTTNAIQNLMKLAPETAIVLRETEVEIPIDELKTGDIIIVKPGSNIPADGVIIEGTASVDESSITGESIPVDKKNEDSVTSGTTNLNGILKIRATKVGKDSTLSQIIQMVSDSAATKAPVQKIADKVSSIFVPVVIGIAIITFIIWYFISKDFGFSLMRGISVLVISCPCALGLATPVAIMVGNGVAAKKGILFKTSVALEKTGKVKTVVLDKTGTITKGHPVVVEAVEIGENTNYLQIAYELEKNSSHPIAKAICDYNSQSSMHSQTPVPSPLPVPKFSNFQELAGCGVQATDITDNATYFCGKIANSNYVCVTKNGRTIGKFKIMDEVREDSRKAVQELFKLGLNVVMLTGDNATNAQIVADEVEIRKIVAGVLPGDKAKKVREIQKDGEVLMAGDGINDAPALSSADVGIAVGGGTDIAIDSADVVLVKNSLCDVAEAIKLSRAVLKNIKENLFWAFFYNILAIPIAAGCFIPLGIELTPAISAACMSFSSFCVVCNALRLNRLSKKVE